MEIDLSIIIVNYNGMGYFQKCFDSIYEKLKTISFEIIVIDNNSNDNSVSFINKNFPKVKLIESKINYGFGKGNNEAVKHANGKYLLLLNNDTIILDDFSSLLFFLQENNDVGAIGINMLNKEKTYLQAAGNFPDFFNLFWMKLAFNFNSDFKTGNFKQDFYNVDWLTGSFLLMPKHVYSEVGGFDEDYFLYVEDVDLCKKIANKGYKRVFCSKLNYIHFVGFNTNKNPMLIKGYSIYIDKHFEGISKIVHKFALWTNKIIKKIK
jgi:GT2 family glycosyltransferase